MTFNSKKPGVAFWATVVVVVALVYVASFGPACWWLAKPLPPLRLPSGATIEIKSDMTIAPVFYCPLGWLAQHGGSPLRKAIRWYATVGRPKVLLPTDWNGSYQLE